MDSVRLYSNGDRYETNSAQVQEDICEMLSEWYGVSDMGVGVVDLDDGITCMDDVVDKFIDAIDYFNKKIAETSEDFREVSRLELADPLLMNYDDAYNRLSIDRIYYEETRDLLQRDLNRITGMIPPWE